MLLNVSVLMVLIICERGIEKSVPRITTVFSGDLGVRSKAQILNFGYHVNFKDSLYQSCVYSHKLKKENILNRISIMLLGSCPRGGTWGSWGQNL